jgi:hypothetical protein
VYEKHKNAPSSFLDAFKDFNLDHLCLFSADGRSSEKAVIAEVYNLEGKDAVANFKAAVKEAKTAPGSGGLVKYLSGLINVPENGSILHDYANLVCKDGLNKAIGFIPESGIGLCADARADDVKNAEGNVAYLLHQEGGKARLLAIYDKKRFIEFVQKGQINQFASGQSELDDINPAAAYYTSTIPGKSNLTCVTQERRNLGNQNSSTQTR